MAAVQPGNRQPATGQGAAQGEYFPPPEFERFSHSLSTGYSATESIPAFFRVFLTTIEPMLALFGAFQILFTPHKYLTTLTRGAVAFRTDDWFVYTQLGGSWLYFAFIELFILTMYDDLRLWKFLCLGMLLSDLTYLHGSAQAVGGWVAWLQIWNWEQSDWMVFGLTLPFMLVRILIVSGLAVEPTMAKPAAKPKKQ